MAVAESTGLRKSIVEWCVMWDSNGIECAPSGVMGLIDAGDVMDHARKTQKTPERVDRGIFICAA